MTGRFITGAACAVTPGWVRHGGRERRENLLDCSNQGIRDSPIVVLGMEKEDNGMTLRQDRDHEKIQVCQMRAAQCFNVICRSYPTEAVVM